MGQALRESTEVLLSEVHVVEVSPRPRLASLPQCH